MELFRLYQPQSNQLPVVANLPHSGTYVPQEIQQNFTEQFSSALYNTDWFLPVLYSFLPELGITVLEATHSRYVVDLNRHPDRTLYGSFFRATIAGQTADGKRIYRTDPTTESLKERVDKFHRPYHAKLQEILAELKRTFKRVYLWDLHSFMGLINEDICLGNANGDTCSAKLIDSFQKQFSKRGFEVVKNKVFTGGYITRHYGQQHLTDAIQIELRYTNYLAESELNVPRKPKIVDEAKFSSMSNTLKHIFKNTLVDIDLFENNSI